jgi:hypothetical protein
MLHFYPQFLKSFQQIYLAIGVIEIARFTVFFRYSSPGTIYEDMKISSGIRLSQIMHQDSPVSDYPLKTRSFRSGGSNYRVSRRPLHEHQATTHGRECPGHPLARCADWSIRAFGFETFAFWQETGLSRLDSFPGTT